MIFIAATFIISLSFQLFAFEDPYVACACDAGQTGPDEDYRGWNDEFIWCRCDLESDYDNPPKWWCTCCGEPEQK